MSTVKGPKTTKRSKRTGARGRLVQGKESQSGGGSLWTGSIRERTARNCLVDR